jgi:hypothetical protein
MAKGDAARLAVHQHSRWASLAVCNRHQHSRCCPAYTFTLWRASRCGHDPFKGWHSEHSFERMMLLHSGPPTARKHRVEPPETCLAYRISLIFRLPALSSHPESSCDRCTRCEPTHDRNPPSTGNRWQSDEFLGADLLAQRHVALREAAVHRVECKQLCRDLGEASSAPALVVRRPARAAQEALHVRAQLLELGARAPRVLAVARVD